MQNISKTIQTDWKRSLISAAPVVAGLLAFTTMAHANQVIELSPGHIAFIELLRLAQLIAAFTLTFSFIGMRSDKRRVFQAAVAGMAFSGVVFLASTFFNDALYRAVEGILS